MVQLPPPATPGGVTTLTALLELRASRDGGRRVFQFLADGEREEAGLTYDQLRRAARAVGARLAAAGAVGERALLVYPPGLDYTVAFYGSLHAGVAAVPAYPPDPARMERSLLRLRALVEDCRPAFGLTTTPLLRMAQAALGGDPVFRSIRWLATDHLDPDAANDWVEPEVDADSLAFIQYTSGSTGAPKGVMVTHGNALHNADMIAFGGGFSRDTISVLWLPTYHDLGLVNGIILPVYTDFLSILMSPADFLRRPLRWLEVITRYRATHCGGPNFAYDLCARKATPEEVERLDLSSWVNAYNGAEPIRKATLDRFADRFASCGFRPEAFCPVYGLAECTVAVTGGKTHPGIPDCLELDERALRAGRLELMTAAAGPVKHLMACGRILRHGYEVRIVDPDTAVPCAADRVGEIWVRSPSVASGYWGRPEETEQTFRAHLAPSGEGPFLRTGDLGAVRGDDLFVTGRIKDLIIIRGVNHYPQDIETTVQASHPALRPGCGAAFSVEENGEEKLVVVHEVTSPGAAGAAWPEVCGAIRAAVLEAHDLQAWGVVLLAPGTIHKTSSGKIQRRACRNSFQEGSLEEVARSVLAEGPPAGDDRMPGRETVLAWPAEARRELLVEAMRHQLARALRLTPEQVSAAAPLIELGLDSLAIMELRHRVETDLRLDLPVELILAGASLTDLAAHLLDRVAAGQRP